MALLPLLLSLAVSSFAAMNCADLKREYVHATEDARRAFAKHFVTLNCPGKITDGMPAPKPAPVAAPPKAAPPPMSPEEKAKRCAELDERIAKAGRNTFSIALSKQEKGKLGCKP